MQIVAVTRCNCVCARQVNNNTTTLSCLTKRRLCGIVIYCKVVGLVTGLAGVKYVSRSGAATLPPIVYGLLPMLFHDLVSEMLENKKFCYRSPETTLCKYAMDIPFACSIAVAATATEFVNAPVVADDDSAVVIVFVHCNRPIPTTHFDCHVIETEKVCRFIW